MAAKVIPTFFALILTLNNIVFNCKHDRQIKCLSMGTLYAPSYANIFIDSFEKIYVYIYPSLQGISLIYLRFIDDIFFMWKDTKEKLKNCLNKLNKKTILSSLNIEYHKLASHFLIQKSLFKIKNLVQKFVGKALTTQLYSCRFRTS